MKIAVISDIHEQVDHLDIVLKQIKSAGIQEAIALGDYCGPKIFRIFASSGLRFKCIFGNNDGDKAGLMRDAFSSGGAVATVTGEYAVYELDGKKVFATHYPDIARPVAHSGLYDAVFYGHDHQLYQEKLDNGCLLLNPGEVWGWLRGTVSYAIWDTDSNTAEIIEVSQVPPLAS